MKKFQGYLLTVLFVMAISVSVVAQNRVVNIYRGGVVIQSYATTQIDSLNVESIIDNTLPLVYITTPNNSPIESKDEWVENTHIHIVMPDGTIVYDGISDNIKGRGNSTWRYPKKPYAIKLDKKASILGMPKHKRWVLLANWMDRTLIRNHVAFEISNRLSMEYTPRGQFVELVLNGEYQGNYYLCEQIKVDENRLNITEMSELDVSGDSVTGGYLLECDQYFDEVNKFRPLYSNLPINIKEPDEDVLTPEQLAYITDYFNTIEEILYNDAEGNIAEYIDFDSFARWFILYELVGSYEPTNPKSCYMYKDKNGLLKAGPAWDFDWFTFTPDKYKLRINNALYYGKLLENPEFVAVLKECWESEKEGLRDISDFVNQTVNLIAPSETVNHEMWPIIDSTVNGDEEMKFEEAVERLIQSYENNYKVLDAEINKMQSGTTEKESGNMNIYCASETLYIQNTSSVEHVAIYNIQGQKLLIATPHTDTVAIPLHAFPAGVYVVMAVCDEKADVKKIIKS